MKIAISGSNGYIAAYLIRKLQSVNHQIIKIQRHELYNLTALTRIISGTDCVIHLAGAPILQKWTTENKDEIVRSRTETTQNLVGAINNLPFEERPKTFISASAIGIYKSDQTHSESSTDYSDEFVGRVVKQWEDSSANLDRSVRKIIFRLGVVLGKESETVRKLMPVFKLGLGGKVGNGKQPFPFVHIQDVVNAFFWAIQNNEVSGIFNLVAPQNIDNSQFTEALAKKLKRMAIFSVPKSALKLVYGEAASILTESPQATPERLIHYGYRFKYPDIESSIEEIAE